MKKLPNRAGHGDTLIDHLRWQLEGKLPTCRRLLAIWMIENGFATGHGDEFTDLLRELDWQVKELRNRIWELEKPFNGAPPQI